MKVIVAALLVGSAVAFTPASVSRGTTQLSETKVRLVKLRNEMFPPRFCLILFVMYAFFNRLIFRLLERS